MEGSTGKYLWGKWVWGDLQGLTPDIWICRCGGGPEQDLIPRLARLYARSAEAGHGMKQTRRDKEG